MVSKSQNIECFSKSKVRKGIKKFFRVLRFSKTSNRLKRNGTDTKI